jgi:hypothetical protein
MRELSYVEEEYPPKVIWLGTGSTLEMYLKQKRSSQVNVLVGFLPNNDQLASNKLLVPVKANLNFEKRTWARVKTIGFELGNNLQVKSPTVEHFSTSIHIFKHRLVLDFAFDIVSQKTARFSMSIYNWELNTF